MPGTLNEQLIQHRLEANGAKYLAFVELIDSKISNNSLKSKTVRTVFFLSRVVVFLIVCPSLRGGEGGAMG